MNTRVNHYVEMMYGGLPPSEGRVHLVLAHQLRRETGVLQIWRVHATDAQLGWLLQVSWPGEPVSDDAQILLSPDACWPHCLTPDVVHAVHQRGVAVASFNRLDVAHDAPNGVRAGPLCDRWPSLDFGAVSAWAWAMGQTALALRQVYRSAQIAVIGHSRSGKAALLAAAAYPCIDAVISHNSGTAGASSLQKMGAGAESLSSLVAAFPHWLGPQAAQAAKQAELIADDGLALWTQIAPRGLMIIQAQDDLWANPEGARCRYEQLRSMWAQRPDALTLLERSGGHAMGRADWAAAADFLSRLDPASATIAP